MLTFCKTTLPLATLGLFATLIGACYPCANAQVEQSDKAVRSSAESASARYQELQRKLAQGWNTWDVNSMTTHVLLPEGLAIHVGFKHNSTEYGDAFLDRTSVGAGTIFPGPHAWDGSFTELKVIWKGHQWLVDSAHDGD